MRDQATLHAVPGPTGLRGWLLVFWIALVFATLLVAVGLVQQLMAWLPRAGKFGKLFLYLSVDSILAVGVVALGVHAAFALLKRRPWAVPWTKAFLVAYLLHELTTRWLHQVFFGMYHDWRFQLPHVAWFLAAPTAAVLAGYSYLARSRRVGATYRVASMEVATRSGMAGTKDLSRALPRLDFGFGWWVACAYLAAALFATLVPPAIEYLVHPGSARAADSVSDAMNVNFGMVDVVFAVPAALAFAVLTGSKLGAWRAVAWWTVISALLAAASTWVGTVTLKLVLELFRASTPFVMKGSATAVSFAWGAVEAGLFISGLVLAVRYWGLRLWSLVAGTVAAGVVFELAGALASRSAPVVGFAAIAPVVVSFLYGLLIFAGIYLHRFGRGVLQPAGEERTQVPEFAASGDAEAAARASIVGIVISLLSLGAAVMGVVSPGRFGIPWAAVLSQFAAGAMLLAWSFRRERRGAGGVAAWVGGAVLGAAVGAVLPFVLR